MLYAPKFQFVRCCCSKMDAPAVRLKDLHPVEGPVSLVSQHYARMLQNSIIQRVTELCQF